MLRFKSCKKSDKNSVIYQIACNVKCRQKINIAYQIGEQIKSNALKGSIHEGFKAEIFARGLNLYI
jgi:hypothetical protein